MEYKAPTYFIEAARKWLDAYKRTKVDATADSVPSKGHHAEKVRTRGALAVGGFTQCIAHNVHYLAYVLGIAYYLLGLLGKFWGGTLPKNEVTGAVDALTPLEPEKRPEKCRQDLETAISKIRVPNPSVKDVVDAVYDIFTELCPNAKEREKALLRFILKRELYGKTH